MIKKIYRLKEREVKKVLKYSKPFFSYGIVLNVSKNKLNYNRFAIVLGSKSVKSWVERNFFRRRFYDFVLKNNLINKTLHFWDWFYDLVFVVKKQTKLDKMQQKSINSFEKDLNFLIKNKWKKS